jgi:hypothetical protein
LQVFSIQPHEIECGREHKAATLTHHIEEAMRQELGEQPINITQTIESNRAELFVPS